MLMAGLDSVPGGLAGDLTPPCVPEDLGNMRFYDAMPAKTWLVNATDYGHGDVINEFYYEGLVVSGERRNIKENICLKVNLRKLNFAGQTRHKIELSIAILWLARCGPS